MPMPKEIEADLQRLKEIEEHLDMLIKVAEKLGLVKQITDQVEKDFVLPRQKST